MAPSRTPLTIESIFAPSAIDTGMPAKATLTKSRLEYAFCMAPPAKRKHTWITNLDNETTVFLPYHTPLAPLTASSRWNFRDPVVVLVTCPSRRVGNDGTDCRSVAAFEGEDCRYLLFAHLPDGRSRPRRSRQVGFRSRPHRGRVLYRCDAALL